MANLDLLESLAYYSTHFMDPQTWKPHVQEICRENALSCGRIRAGVSGTFPTFIVSPEPSALAHGQLPVVVKFFGPLFDGETAFRTELEMGMWLAEHKLPVSSPAILAQGKLDERWKYLVFEFIPGESVNQARSDFSRDDLVMVAREMGKTLKQLHAPSYTGESAPLAKFSKPGVRFIQFLKEQKDRCCNTHRAWGDLPKHLLESLEKFLLPVEELVDPDYPLHVIHADLTGDHLLGSVENGAWQSLAIIDWGDARQGNILYEFIALHLDMFMGDPTLLQECLKAYDLPDFYRKDFPRKALNMALLHTFPLPRRIVKLYETAPSLEEMAEGIFG